MVTQVFVAHTISILFFYRKNIRDMRVTSSVLGQTRHE